MNVRGLFAASACAVVAGVATSAGAMPSTLTVTSVAMTQPTAFVLISGPGIDDPSAPETDEETAEVAPLELTLAGGRTVLAFCVDIWHAIDLGSVSSSYGHSSLVYQQAALTTNSSGTVTGTGDSLSSAQIGEVGGLAKLGYDLQKADPDPADLPVDLSAIQAAIWQIENPSLSITASAPSDGRNTQAVYDALSTQITYYEGWAVTHQDADISAYYDTVDETQGLATPTPEPMTWALMLVGIGGVGVSRRAGRRSAGTLPL
jgi:hypothetical protein